MKVGTLNWARRTGGQINFQDKLMLALTGMKASLRDIPPLLWWKMGLPVKKTAFIDISSFKFPDTKAASSAEALLNELTPPFMINHSIRTYLWSRLLAEYSSLQYDDELLYIGSLLHDIGFYGPYLKSTPDTECFTIRSANAAVDVVQKNKWTTKRQDLLAETMILNANPDVGIEQGVVAHIMQKGVSIDIMGTGVWKVNHDTKNAVVEKYPRLNQNKALWPTWKTEADTHPCCRAHFYNRYFQFEQFLKLAPFD